MKKSVKKNKSAILARNLQRWFKASSRDLPWRINSDPYRVWLSEIMLQQTQVVTVIPYFNRFFDRFPTISDLADADIESIYELWSGLGYYSRARNLHRGAQVIASRLKENKGFPSNRDEWLEIPGVGPYTAGAICSIALDQPEPIVDGNVVRVLSRVFAISKLDSQKSEIWNQASQIVKSSGISPRCVNQALMELGALVCKPRNPDCDRCPVREECAGRKSPEDYPPPKPKKKWKNLQEERWVLISDSKVFLVKNPQGRWRKGLWDFPAADEIRVGKARLLHETQSRYVVTHHRVNRLHRVFDVDPNKVKALSVVGQWVELDALPGVPAPVRKFLKTLTSKN